MSSTGTGASGSDLDAALARLSGPDLVAHLRVTCRRADYDAAARVLRDRDRRLAHAEAALAEEVASLTAEVEALRERCLQLKAKEEEESRRPSSRSSGGAIAAAAAAPRVGRHAEEPGPVVAIIDLCDSSDDDEEEEEELEEGEFRPDVAGVSCKRKESADASMAEEWRRAGVSCERKESADASVAMERRRAGVPCERKEPASASSPDDEDDTIPLSQLFKKRRRAKLRAVNGEPKKGHGAAQANSSGPLGVDRPVISPVNRGIPEAVAEHMVGSPDHPKVADFVQRSQNGQPGKNGGLSRTMPSPPPTGSTAGNSSRKDCSKPDCSEGRARIGEKQGPVAGPVNDSPVQLKTPSVTDTARRIVGSERVGTETPMEHTDSSSDGTISVVLKSVQGQEKGIGGVHETKVSLETNGTGAKTNMVLRDTRDQGKPDGQVLHTKVLSRTDGIREQGGKLSPCQSLMDTHGGRPTTSDKPVSATLQQKNYQPAPHSEQMSLESSLPSAVTRHWKSSSDVFNSCLGNKELCMQAVCALHRQWKFTTKPTRGGITKFDAHRVAMLVEFLLDGNLQGPLKRTAEDLEKHDFTGHDFLERVALQSSEQLFSIYRNKADRYFH